MRVFLINRIHKFSLEGSPMHPIFSLFDIYVALFTCKISYPFLLSQQNCEVGEYERYRLSLFPSLPWGNGKWNGIWYDGKCWNSRDLSGFLCVAWSDPARRGHGGRSGCDSVGRDNGGPSGICRPSVRPCRLPGHVGGGRSIWRPGSRTRRTQSIWTNLGKSRSRFSLPFSHL